jgi:ABC-2 type transport system permease protein
MQKIWSIAMHDLRITFADRSVWLGLVIIPIVIIFFIGFANGGFGGQGAVRLLVDVFDNDGSDLSQQFVSELKALNPDIVVCPQDNGEDDACNLEGAELTETLATERLEEGRISAIVIIPENFGERALTGEPADIIYRSRDQLGQISAVSQTVQTVIQRLGAAVTAARVGVNVFEESPFEFADAEDKAAFQQAVYDRAKTIWTEIPQAVSYSESMTQQGGRPSGFSQSVPGIGTMYVMATVMVGAIVLLTERKQGTFQRMMTMPVTPTQIVGGKMLARFVMGMIQYGVAFAFGLLLGVYFGNSPLALLLLMVTFTLSCTALTLLFATFVTSEQQAGSLLNLILLVLAPLGGAWWPLEITPTWMQTIGHVSPVAWVMEGFRSVIFRSGGVSDIIVPVLVMLGFTAVFFALATRRIPKVIGV